MQWLPLRRQQSKHKKTQFDPKDFLAHIGEGRTIANYRQNDIICKQGDPLDAVFYIEIGRVKLSIVSPNGKEAVLSLRGDGDFFGERCVGPRHAARHYGDCADRLHNRADRHAAADDPLAA